MTDARTPVGAVDVIAIVTSTDGATVVAVHDRAARRIEITCSAHPGFSAFSYDRGITDADRDWLREDAALSAAKHAADHHTPPRVDNAGEHHDH